MDVGQPVHGAVYGVGRVLGTGIPGCTGEGYTGYYPPTDLQLAHRSPRSKPTQRSGPVGPAGPEWWGGCSGRNGGRGRSWVPPFGPGQAPCALPVPRTSQIAHLQPKGRDFMTFLRNLVKTAKCRLNVSKRPVIVPIFQNRPQMSPLEILRFPFLPAFSCKELMGHI